MTATLNSPGWSSRGWARYSWLADVSSPFWVTAGVLALRTAVLPRWLGWVSIVTGILLFLQGFGLGGVIAAFGLVLDLIGFLLLLIFVLVSSIVLFRRKEDGELLRAF